MPGLRYEGLRGQENEYIRETFTAIAEKRPFDDVFPGLRPEKPPVMAGCCCVFALMDDGADVVYERREHAGDGTSLTGDEYGYDSEHRKAAEQQNSDLMRVRSDKERDRHSKQKAGTDCEKAA